MRGGRAKRFAVAFELSDHAIDSETHVIELRGEVDLYTAPEFKTHLHELIDEGKTHIVIDLSQVTYIDSTTLGVLVGGLKRLRRAGGSLVLVCTEASIVHIFDVTGLDQALPVYATVEEAIAGSALRDDT